MYVSKPDEFLFIKSNKTAGTSVEIALSVCLSNRNHQFFTPITFEDEITRINHSGLSFSRQMKSIIPNKKRDPFQKKIKHHLRQAKYKLLLPFRRDLGNFSSLRLMHQMNAKSFVGDVGYFNHITYDDCLSRNPAFAEYWSCTFARHPYKRFLSFLSMATRNYLQDTINWKIEDWKNLASSKIYDFCDRNINHFAIDGIGHKSVTKILAFEKMKDATNLMCEALCLPVDSIYNAMPNAKSKYSSIMHNKISPDDIINVDIKSKLLQAEEFVFEGLGYKDSFENFVPDRISFSL